MKLDAKIAKINALIKASGAAIFAGEAPDMVELDADINEFIKQLGTLPTAQVRDYANLVNIWAEEIRKMSEKLSETRSGLTTEINQAQTQSRANKAYRPN